MLVIMVIVILICNLNYMLKDKAPLFLNITPSMPIGIYMMIPGNEYKPGDIVIYSPTVSSLDYFYKYNYEIPETDFIKEIGAVPGDKYSVDKETGIFLVSGKYIGIAKKKDSQGNDLPEHSGEYTVPEGEFLPVTHYAGSFDGRYIGTMPMDRIKNKVIPVVIFEL